MTLGFEELDGLDWIEAFHLGELNKDSCTTIIAHYSSSPDESITINNYETLLNLEQAIKYIKDEYDNCSL